MVNYTIGCFVLHKNSERMYIKLINVFFKLEEVRWKRTLTWMKEN